MFQRRRAGSLEGTDLLQAAQRGELRLELRPDGHVYRADDAELAHKTPPPYDGVEQIENLEDQEQIAANRARIEELRRERIGGVNDLSDALGKWRVVFPAVCVFGAIAIGVTRVLAPLGWLVISVLLFAAVLLVVVELQRRDRHE
jgi:hypothetical protein